jgi:hypothetical protein
MTARQPLLPHQREKTADFPLRVGRLKPGTLQVVLKALFPQGTQKPSVSHFISLQETHVFPVKDPESQLLPIVAIHYPSGCRRPIPHSGETQ